MGVAMHYIKAGLVAVIAVAVVKFVAGKVAPTMRDYF